MALTPLPHRARAADAEPAERIDDRDLLRQVLAGLAADTPDLEECPGDLLVHADGRVECLAADDCPTDPALHVGVVRCADDVEDGCCRQTG